MPARKDTQLEIPKVESRHRWNFTMYAGLDLEAALGIPSQASDLAALASEGNAFPTIGAAGGLGGLVEVGTIESVDLGQRRDATQRKGFNSNALQPFQVAPHGSTPTIRLSRIVLKKLPEVEASFQFLPSNLLLQQFPFVIEMRDVGDGEPESFVRHFIYGCWFTETAVRYDVVSKDDTRLIQTANIMTGRMLTFDPSLAGSPTVQTASGAAGIVLQALQANSSIQNLLEDFELG